MMNNNGNFQSILNTITEQVKKDPNYLTRLLDAEAKAEADLQDLIQKRSFYPKRIVTVASTFVDKHDHPISEPEDYVNNVDIIFLTISHHELLDEIHQNLLEKEINTLKADPNPQDADDLFIQQRTTRPTSQQDPPQDHKKKNISPQTQTQLDFINVCPISIGAIQEVNIVSTLENEYETPVTDSNSVIPEKKYKIVNGKVIYSMQSRRNKISPLEKYNGLRLYNPFESITSARLLDDDEHQTVFKENKGEYQENLDDQEHNKAQLQEEKEKIDHKLKKVLTAMQEFILDTVKSTRVAHSFPDPSKTTTTTTTMTTTSLITEATTEHKSRINPFSPSLQENLETIVKCYSVDVVFPTQLILDGFLSAPTLTDDEHAHIQHATILRAIVAVEKEIRSLFQRQRDDFLPNSINTLTVKKSPIVYVKTPITCLPGAIQDCIFECEGEYPTEKMKIHRKYSKTLDTNNSCHQKPMIMDEFEGDKEVSSVDVDVGVGVGVGSGTDVGFGTGDVICSDINTGITFDLNSETRMTMKHTDKIKIVSLDDEVTDLRPNPASTSTSTSTPLPTSTLLIDEIDVIQDPLQTKPKNLILTGESEKPRLIILHNEDEDEDVNTHSHSHTGQNTSSDINNDAVDSAEQNIFNAVVTQSKTGAMKKKSLITLVSEDLTDLTDLTDAIGLTDLRDSKNPQNSNSSQDTSRKPAHPLTPSHNIDSTINERLDIIGKILVHIRKTHDDKVTRDLITDADIIDNQKLHTMHKQLQMPYIMKVVKLKSKNIQKLQIIFSFTPIQNNTTVLNTQSIADIDTTQTNVPITKQQICFIHRIDKDNSEYNAFFDRLDSPTWNTQFSSKNSLFYTPVSEQTSDSSTSPPLIIEPTKVYCFFWTVVQNQIIDVSVFTKQDHQIMLSKTQSVQIPSHLQQRIQSVQMVGKEHNTKFSLEFTLMSTE